MYFTTRPNTVFLLVGPSMSGKSTFARALMRAVNRAAEARSFRFQTTILSSDEIRYDLLGRNDDRHAPSMLEMSKQAFDILMARYKALISYPVNHDFVVVDTTGMNEVFRDEIREAGLAQGYAVELITFEYDKAEALRNVPPRYHDAIKWQLDAMKKKVLPNLKASKYTKRTRIQEKSPTKWSDMVVSVENIDTLSNCLLYLAKDESVAIIGDVHEHSLGANAIISKLYDYKPKYTVWVGDYLDKGHNTEFILRFMLSRTIAGDIFVEGNHESYVARRLRGEIEPNPEIEEKYITSLALLQEREDLRKIFFEIYDNFTVPFLKITAQDGRTVFVTHAPCQEVHLGKLTAFARRAQRNLHRESKYKAKPGEVIDQRVDYEFIFDEANPIHPLHVFGHIAHSSTRLNYKNKIFLDTGAVYGNKLTAFVYKNNNYEFVSVATERQDTTEQTLNADATSPIKVVKEFDIREYDLDERDFRFLNNFIKNEAKYISGTMVPAPKTETELESLEAALDYYAVRNVEQVILEPKYMGSRSQLYLFKGAPEKSFMTSRNGYKIYADRVPGLQELMDKEYEKYFNSVGDDGLICKESLILDGELLPWSALGKDLIDRQFTAYEVLVAHELNTLENDEWFAKLEFDDLTELKGKERFFRSKPDVHAKQGDLSKFRVALSHYSQAATKLEFRAFSVLSVDGKDWMDKDQSSVFAAINDDTYMTLFTEDLLGEDREDALILPRKFYSELTTDRNMEGVVVKPLVYTKEMEERGVLPYMKVRNEEYLRLVYGYDYHSRYEKLRQQKNIVGKSKLSMTEYRLGRAMLTAEPNKLKEAVVKMIASIKDEKKLDPRL